jgi:hypothetical protein
MAKKEIDELAELMSKIFGRLESEAKMMSHLLLYSKVELDPVAWKSYQTSMFSRFEKELGLVIKKELPLLNNALEKVIVLNSKLATGKLDILKELETLREKKIVDVEIPKLVKDRIVYFKDIAKKTVQSVTDEVLREHKRKVLKIGAFSLLQTQKTNTLYQNIKQATEEGIDKQPKILTPSGKQMSYKTYTEMVVRTGLMQDAAKLQEYVGRMTGVAFYIASSHSDSAPDHKDYQGKIYYDENWRQMVPKELHADVQTLITRTNMKSFQWVKDEPVYMTTRPNCRHKFMPLSIDEVLEKTPNQLLNELNLKKGNYNPKHYEALQEQRYNERNIRKWKEQRELHEKAIELVKDKELKDDLLNSLKRDNMFIRKWQSKQQTLISKNPNVLQRDFRRESNEIIIQDLGVRYNIKAD